MDFRLTEEQQAVQDMVRKFADADIAPGAAERDRTQAFPTDIVRKAGALGLCGILTPPEYGGAGMDAVSYAIAIEEISRACASTGVIIAVQNSLAQFPIYKFGADDQKQRYIPRLASGEIVGAYALTEPGSGSDAAALATTARLDGDAYLLNGTKCFVTNSSGADLWIVYATTDASQGHKGIGAFIVEKSFPGVAIARKEEMIGVRASGTCTLTFENARVPAANLVGDIGAGFKIALATLDLGRIGIAAQAAGIGRACLEASLKYAGERHQFGKPINAFQLVQEMLVQMATELDAARLLTYRACLLRDQGAKFTKEASMAKWYASEAAMRAASNAVQIHGGYGYMEEYPVCRFYRDAKVLTIGEGTDEVQQLVISRALLA